VLELAQLYQRGRWEVALLVGAAAAAAASWEKRVRE